MKFVYFGYDFMLPSILRLQEAGHELMAVFSFACDGIFNFNHECQALCRAQRIPFILSPAEDFHIAGLLEQGAQCFLAAGYPYKIPPIEENAAYAVNVHPSRLPLARGLMPVPRIIMGDIKKAAGLTAHKMTPVFDGGDILSQCGFTLDSRETVETYCAKIAMRAPDMLCALMENLPSLWAGAKPQNQAKASTFSPPAEHERILDWNKTVAEIDRTGRSFGRFGSLADIGGARFIVFAYDFWQEKHVFAPGHIAAHLSREVTIAAKDGFVCLKDFQKL
ncbi:MAG: hypothetical protein IT559_02055 [Alphaproteobacteria bacterium]|nr:hypothetical protein [Alphaproteobacteria bacterium]